MATEPADSPAAARSASPATAAARTASPATAAATTSRTPTTAAETSGPTEGEKAPPQTTLGPHRAGGPAGVRRRGGGHRCVDGLDAAPDPRPGPLPRAARHRQGHHLAAGRL